MVNALPGRQSNQVLQLSLSPFLIKRGRPQFFRCFQAQSVKAAQDLTRSTPDRAAAGCATLLADLQSALEEAEKSDDRQAASLLVLTLSAFPTIGLAAMARGQTVSEREDNLARARALVAQLDQATQNMFSLVTWMEEIASS